MSFGGTHLRDPALFPAGPDGSLCGTHDVVINLPGGPYRFFGLTKDQRAHVLRRFGACVADPPTNLDPSAQPGLLGRQGMVEVPLFRAPIDRFRPLNPSGSEIRLDLDHQPSSVRLAGHNFMARLEWSTLQNSAIWTSAQDAFDDAFEGVFENFFRVLVAYRLLALGGVLLHSAGVVGPNGANLFFGPTRSGKSTLAALALAASRTLLSDDLNALLPTESRIQVTGVPFTGDFPGTPQPLPSHRLAGLFLLRQSRETSIRSLKAGQGVAALLSCSPHTSPDRFRQMHLAENHQSILDRVPVYELSVAQHDSFEHLETILPS